MKTERKNVRKVERKKSKIEEHRRREREWDIVALNQSSVRNKICLFPVTFRATVLRHSWLSVRHKHTAHLFLWIFWQSLALSFRRQIFCLKSCAYGTWGMWQATNDLGTPDNMAQMETQSQWGQWNLTSDKSLHFIMAKGLSTSVRSYWEGFPGKV